MYMFHQANVVPTATFLEGEEDMSLLELWYRVVLEELSEYINIKGPAESSFGVKVRLRGHRCFVTHRP